MIRRYSKKEIYKISKLLEKSSLLSGYTNNYLGGEEIQKFETEFAKFHGCKYGISVNSGTSALFVAQKAAGIKKSKKVGVPCITFTATTSQVLACDAIPIFSDIDKNTYCMDFNFQKSVDFVIPVHLLGYPIKYDKIKQLKEKDIFVIEDCAQATGAKSGNKMVGSMGDCGIFSFQETKHLTTLGEGGMIVTNNEEFTEKCRRIRNHGEYYKDGKEVGYNFRMTEIQAAFGRMQLKRLPKILESFKNNASYIFKNLPSFIVAPSLPKNSKHAFFILGCKYDQKQVNFSRELFLEQLTIKRRKILGDNLSDIKGVNASPGKIIGSGYRVVQYDIPLYKKFTPKKSCIVGESFVKESLFLDIHRWRSRSEIKYELELIRDVSKKLSN